MKSTDHGLLRSRPPKRRHSLGNHPTRTGTAPSSPMQKRDNETHWLVKVEIATVTDQGPHRRRAAKGGLSEKLRGKRLATDKRHRVDTAKEATGLALHAGGRSGWRNCVYSKDLLDRVARQHGDWR